MSKCIKPPERALEDFLQKFPDRGPLTHRVALDDSRLIASAPRR